MSYDPLEDLEPEQWLKMSESERLGSIVLYHRAHATFRPHSPTERNHAAVHAMVEGHLAEGVFPELRATLRRLMEEEHLDRHEAVHALGSVVVEFFWGAAEDVSGTNYEELVRRLDALSAQGWHGRSG